VKIKTSGNMGIKRIASQSPNFVSQNYPYSLIIGNFKNPLVSREQLSWKLCSTKLKEVINNDR